jgi:SAM-dependent methyltransferase
MEESLIGPFPSERPAYDGYAAAFAEAAERNAYNALYDRPAVLDVLGDVQGQQVLDAGCGPGLYAAELCARGAAKVIGFDQSSDAVRLAKDRLGPEVSLRQHDLDDPLDWLPDASVDAAIMALVIHYVHDRVAALREIHRVLRPHGWLVLSTTHPTADWLTDGGSYFEERYVEDRWSCGLHSRFWRQPLDRWFSEFFAAGFVIDQFLETRPTPQMALTHPIDYAKLRREPGFMTVRLVKKIT